MEPIAFLNGSTIPFNELSVPVDDCGFMLGATVAEQLRTFHGRPFQVSRHLNRFFNGLDHIEVRLPWDQDEIEKAIRDLASHNLPLCPKGHDLGICVFATPGPYSAFTSGGTPMLAIHTYPLPFHSWADQYDAGVHATIVDIRQIPNSCWPSDLKCRSRMHYFLANQAARKESPGATAILLDQAGNVSETPTANIVAFFEGQGLVTVPHDHSLPGISLSYLASLAKKLEIPFRFETLTPNRLLTATEVFLTSTPFCMLPVVRIDDTILFSSRPGPLYARLLETWSREVGVSIADQAKRQSQSMMPSTEASRR